MPEVTKTEQLARNMAAEYEWRIVWNDHRHSWTVWETCENPQIVTVVPGAYGEEILCTRVFSAICASGV